MKMGYQNVILCEPIFFIAHDRTTPSHYVFSVGLVELRGNE